MKVICALCDLASECIFISEPDATTYCGNVASEEQTIVDFSEEIREEIMENRT